MKPAPFDYHAPTTVESAVTLLSELDEAKVIAGGQSFVPLLSLRLSRFDHLVDLRLVDGLGGIERGAASLRLGASTTQTAVERSAEVAQTVPLLARAIPLIGHFQIRNRGTIGGTLAHADPAAEIPAVALALDAQVETASPRGSRTIPATDFFTGIWTTAIADDEIVTGVEFPVWDGRCGFAIEEVARRHGDFAIAGACVAVQLDDDATITRCAIGLLGLGPTPLRADAAEQSVAGVSVSEVDGPTLGSTSVDDLGEIPSDLNGSADYRAHIGAAVVARAWDRAVEEALNG